ncbi:Gfo/Idh/MocA family protein [Rubritalea tangerina]|uniref:Gfo/Idh/MocA family protein n=1 Tax=Rubritalea tangerina TaxID=430798 RepID=A0ABW4ZEU2_9BACT
MLTLAVCGCGSRARTYSKIATLMADRYQVVAGADPVAERVDALRNISENPDFRGFDSAEALLAQPKLADLMVIGTQDNYHFEPAKIALEKGYHLLLEKPAAQNVDEVIALARLAKKYDRKIVLCFVLRYTPFYKKIHQLIQEGALGDVISLNASEGVEPFHQAHSFVRGHWSKSEDSTPMIIAKCSHDLDIISWLVNSPCKSVNSFGGLQHFNSENAPEGAALRCGDGCPHAQTCTYSTERYFTDRERWLQMIYPDPENIVESEVREWFKTAPWGRCVYHCDNDVVDHQIVNMEFDNGTTASLTMTAFDSGRHLQLFGTKASLRGGDTVKAEHECDIVLRHHKSGDIEKITLDPPEAAEGYQGHGGGDYGLMDQLDHIIHGSADQSSLIEFAIEGHLIGFRAEESRLQQGKTLAVH